MASYDDLLQQGIAAAKAGQQEQARQLLAQAIKANPASEAAWIWMSSVVASNDQRIHCLQQVLAINPGNELAQRGLKALGASPEPPTAPLPTQAWSEPAPAEPEAPLTFEYNFGTPTPEQPPAQPVDEPEPSQGFDLDFAMPLPSVSEPSPFDLEFGAAAEPPAAPVDYGGPRITAPPPAAPRPVPPAPDGVPLVDQEQISSAQRDVEVALRKLNDPTVASTPLIRWIEPGAKAERAPVNYSRYLPIALAGLVGVLAVAGAVICASAVGGVIRRVASGQVAGPVVTNAPTPTKRPPRTATPDGTAYIAGPTIPPANAPRGDTSFGKLTATPPYVNTPHPGSSFMSQSVKSFNGGFYEDALDSLDKARDSGDTSVDGYFIEGMANAHAFDYDEAIAAYNAGLAKDDQFAPLHAGLAQVYIQTNKIEQARAEATRAIELDPNLVMAYVVLSQVQMADGDYAAALQTITTGREKNNKYDLNLIVAEGDIYLAQSDFNNATADGNLAYYIDPTAEGAVLLLARGQIGLKLNSSATVILENYIDNVNPGSAASWKLLARLYNQEGRLIDALEANNRAIQLSSDNQSDALASRGLLYLEQGKLDLGCADLKSALESDGQNYDARLGRAQCAYALGQYDDALEDVEFLRGITPNNPVVQTVYVQVLVKKERYNDAISYAGLALKSGALSQEQLGFVYESWGYALYKLGNYSEAAANIEAALAIAETGTRHYYKGLILEGLRDYPRASREFEWVLFWDRIYDYSFAADAEDRLANANALIGRGTDTPTPTITPTKPTATPTKPASATPGRTASPGTPTQGKTATPGKTGTPPKTPTPGASGTPPKTSTPAPPKTPTPGG